MGNSLAFKITLASAVSPLTVRYSLWCSWLTDRRGLEIVGLHNTSGDLEGKQKSSEEGRFTSSLTAFFHEPSRGIHQAVLPSADFLASPQWPPRVLPLPVAVPVAVLLPPPLV
ncbi:hypothetical protein NL676_030383 [Syzygium grande]|nr:hypothetical protein NL676_030383 [Syzygium grande]